MEFFTDSELKDTYFDKLKNHLHLNMFKRLSNEHKGELFIDLSNNSTKNEENERNDDLDNENVILNDVNDVKKNSNQLIMPTLI